MAVERIAIAAPWRWLQQAAALLRRQPRALLGGAALLVAIGLVPTTFQALLLPLLPGQAGLVQGVAFALQLLIFPPAAGGFLRLLHAADGGTEVRPGEVLSGFSDGRLARRMVILNLLFVALSVLAISLLSYAPGGQALAQFGQSIAALKPGATALPPFPAQSLPLVVAIALALVMAISAQGFANADAALREQAPLAALASGLRAVWRNVGALLLCYLPLSILLFLVGMLVALAVVLVSLLLGTVLGQGVAQVLIVVMGVLAAIALYALLFGFFYYGWRELFDDAPAPPEAPHQIAA